jgi:chromosome segregation ATPase
LKGDTMNDTRDTDTSDGLSAQLWGALKNALIDEDPIANARRAKLQGGAAPAATTTVASTRSAPAAAPAARAPLSPMAAALLEQVLSKATAYTALTEKLSPLESIIADERTRYQAAYALIKGSRTVEQVVQSIDMQHMQALEAEAGRFAAQLREKERAEVDARSSESQTLTANIDAANRRIQEIEASVARDRERLALVTQEIDAKRQELAGAQQQFDAAAATVQEALATAKATVLRYLA